MNYWRKVLFTEPIAILFFILCFLLALFYHYRQRLRILFLVYFFCGTILFFATDLILVLKIFTERQMIIFRETSNTIFELIEFITFYNFFKGCLEGERFKKVLDMIFILFTFTSLIFFIELISSRYPENEIEKHSFYINIIEFLLLSGMCLIYFYELFATIPKLNLFKRPSFFIVTATFFYTVFPIPFFMLARDVFSTSIYDMLSACHYLLLIVMLLSLSKAFLWKNPITT